MASDVYQPAHKYKPSDIS